MDQQSQYSFLCNALFIYWFTLACRESNRIEFIDGEIGFENEIVKGNTIY
jgi:hypothetical protein